MHRIYVFVIFGFLATFVAKNFVTFVFLIEKIGFFLSFLVFYNKILSFLVFFQVRFVEEY